MKEIFLSAQKTTIVRATVLAQSAQSVIESLRGITSIAVVVNLLSFLRGIGRLLTSTMLDYSVVKDVESWSSTTSTRTGIMGTPMPTTGHARYITHAVWVFSVVILFQTGSLAKAVATFLLATTGSIILHNLCFGIPMFYRYQEEEEE